MVLITGVVTIDASKRQEVIEASISVMQEARKQPGCISYVIASNLEDPAVLYIFEEWKSDEAHRAYVANPRVEAARLVAAGLGLREVAFQKYQIASIGPVV